MLRQLQCGNGGLEDSIHARRLKELGFDVGKGCGSVVAGMEWIQFPEGREAGEQKQQLFPLLSSYLHCHSVVLPTLREGWCFRSQFILPGNTLTLNQKPISQLIPDLPELTTEINQYNGNTSVLVASLFDKLKDKE